MQDVNTLENAQQGQPQGAGPQSAGGSSPQGQVEPSGSRQGDTSVVDRRQGGADPEQARRRWESKQAQRMEALENAVSQLVTTIGKAYQPQVPPSGQNPDLWQDPEGYLSAREQRLKEDFASKLEQTRAQTKIEVETRMASDLIKSEAGYDPQTIEEIESVGVSNGYQHIARHDPLLAAEQSIEAWKRWKGAQTAHQTPATRAQTPTRAQAMGVNGSAPLTAGNGIRWTPEKIAEARNNGTYSKYRNEILADVKNRLLG